jgi:hypothetical protein
LTSHKPLDSQDTKSHQANVCQVFHLARYAVSIHIFRLN